MPNPKNTVAEDLRDLEEHLAKFGLSVRQVLLEMAARFHGVPREMKPEQDETETNLKAAADSADDSEASKQAPASATSSILASSRS